MPRGRRTASSNCRITAAICPDRTDRGAARAVASLTRQLLAKNEYEILVVGAADIARPPGSSEIANLRLVDPVADLTEARNLAMRLAQAPLVAFIDGGATAEPGWLASLCRAFDEFGEAARVVGGRVRPVWEAPRPDWLADELLADLCIVDLGDETRFLDAGERLAAVNIAFRKASLEALGGFRRPGGVRPPERAAMTFGTELLDELTEPASRAVYEPRAAVDYPIPGDCLRQEWFRGSAAWRAVADLTRVVAPEPVAVAARWQGVKDFFFDCPPNERTVRALALRQDDPRRFRQQISAIYDSIFCLLSGVDEPEYD